MPRYRVMLPKVSYEAFEVETPTPLAAASLVMDGCVDKIDELLKVIDLDTNEVYVVDTAQFNNEPKEE